VEMEQNQPIIAVVDDDPRVRESVEALLSSAGMRAKTFSTAEEFLKTDQMRVACCLITDVRMPGIDGWELQRIVMAEFPNLPIIFITAHQDEVARARAAELGAFAILYKPFDGEELLEIVTAALTESETRI